MICNGRGSCICGGVCQCSADDFDFSVYGRYCECDDVNCARGAGGNLCSGNGECKCGDCRFSIGMLIGKKRWANVESPQVRGGLVGRRLQLRREREPLLFPLQRGGLLEPRGKWKPTKAQNLSNYRRSFQTCECNRCRCDTAEDGRVFSGKAAFGP